MKQYRLKSEAVPFFIEKLATIIHSLDAWEQYGVDIKALEEVKSPFIIFGHQSKTKSINSSSLSGWDNEGSHFHFTIKFPSVKFHDHDRFSNGKIVRELMDKIQSKINYHFQDFINEEQP